jgi:hypothetical protein
MGPSGRPVVLGTLGLMTVLTAVFAVWSIVTSPKVYDVQLQTAAKNTATASSFDAGIDFTVTTDVLGSLTGGTGSLPRHQVVSVTGGLVYNAPDKVYVKETLSEGSVIGRVSVTETQIGSSCWVSIVTTRGPETGSGCDSGSINGFLNFLKGMESATDVDYKNGAYYLTTSDSRTFLKTALPSLVSGANFSGGFAKNLSLSASVSGSYISREHLTLGGSQTEPIGGLSIKEKVDLVLTFQRVGSAPAVARPAGPPTATG